MRLIDADKALEDMAGNMTEKVLKIPYEDFQKTMEVGVKILEVVKNLLNSAPTVDAEQHGKWIRKETYNEIIDKYVPWIECSECGYAPFYTEKTAYCGNCGARMDKEQEHDLHKKRV